MKRVVQCHSASKLHSQDPNSGSGTGGSDLNVTMHKRKLPWPATRLAHDGIRGCSPRPSISWHQAHHTMERFIDELFVFYLRSFVPNVLM